nr:hypothetical transcript [Hymenolepis microstoma]
MESYVRLVNSNLITNADVTNPTHNWRSLRQYGLNLDNAGNGRKKHKEYRNFYFRLSLPKNHSIAIPWLRNKIFRSMKARCCIKIKQCQECLQNDIANLINNTQHLSAYNQ